MATNTTPETTAADVPALDPAAPAADVPALDPAAPAVTHDRAVTPVGAGRITFKGHNAKAGYPFRIYEGRVEALVDGAWVEAADATPLES